MGSIKNSPCVPWGVLVVVNGNGSRISQVYYPDDDSAPWYRIYGAGNSSVWQSWCQLSTKNDIDSINNKISTLGAVKTINGTAPDSSGNIQVPAYAPNLLLGTSHTSITKAASGWGDAFRYTVSESIPKGTRISIRAHISNQTNTPISLIGWSNGYTLPFDAGSTVTVAPHSTGYAYNTLILSKDFDKNDGSIYTVFANQTSESGNVTVSDVKLAVWADPNTPPDMTWVPNVADKADTSYVNTVNNQVTALEAGYMKIETGYMKNPTVISQADYDKLATKDPNTLYEITE